MSEDEYQEQLELIRLTQGMMDNKKGAFRARWVNYFAQQEESVDEQDSGFDTQEIEVEGSLQTGLNILGDDDERIKVEILVTDGLRIKGYNEYQSNLIIFGKILGEAEAYTFLQKYAAKYNKTVTWEEESGFTSFKDLKPNTLITFSISASTVAEIMGKSGSTTDGFVEEALRNLRTQRARKFLYDHLHQAVKPDTKTKLLYVSMAKMIDEFTDEEWNAYEQDQATKTNGIPTSDFSKIFAQFQKYYDAKIRPHKRNERKHKIYRPGSLANPFKCRLFHTPDAEQLIYTYQEDAEKGHHLGIDSKGRGSYGVYVRIIKMALNELLRFHSDYKPLPLTLPYDKATYDAVYLFQTISKINKDGTVGKETLRQLDAALYNKRNTRKNIEEEALVWNEAGAALLQTPAPDAKVLLTMPFNGKMLVHEETFPGWYKVTYSGKVNGAQKKKAVEDSEVVTGYVKSYQIKLGLGPDKEVQLHEVTENSLEEIINTFYAPNVDKDRSFYANALLFYNHRYGKGGIYVKDNSGKRIKIDKNAEEFHYEYDQIHVDKGTMIWLPGNTFMGFIKQSREAKSATFGAAVRRGYEDLNKSIGDFLARYMPEGSGIYLDAELGITAFSLGGDVEGGFYVYRKGKNLIVERRSIVRIGLDVGAGAGAFYSTGGKAKKEPDKKKGVGAEVGVNAMLKAKTVLFQTYNFDMHKEILPAFLVLSYSDNKGSLKYMMLLLFSQMAKLGINTDNFLVKSKFGVGVEARAAASASVGARLGKEDMHPTAYGKNNYADNRQGSGYAKGTIQRLHNLINMKLGLNLGVEGMVGKEVEFADAEGNPAKQSEAKYMNVNVYREFKVEAGVSLPFWMFLLKPSLLPLALMPKIIGAGVKEKYQLNIKTEKLEHVNNAIYLQTGEIDYYVGNASEIEIDIDKRDTYKDLVKAFYNFDDKEFKFDTDRFINMVQQIQIKKRVGYPVPVLNRGAVHKEYMKYTTVKRLLKRDPATTTGFKAMAFVTLEFQLQNAQVKEAVDAAVILAKSIAKGAKEEKDKMKGNVTGYIWQKIMLFMATGHISVSDKYSKEIWSLIDILFDEQVIQSADLMIQAGFSLGMGAKAGAAVKFRAQGYGSVGVIYHRDIKMDTIKALKALAQEGKKRKSLQHIFSAKSK